MLQGRRHGLNVAFSQADVCNYGLCLLVVRPAVGLIVADRRVSGVERRLYLHMLSRWGQS